MARYTLAVGRAPFHAAKREDIYRKLKACEYAWPDLAKFSNDITDDLRDIVSLLLVHEDDRPTPDQIVNHSFFKLGHIPLQLDSACTSRVPKWPKIRPPTASTIRRGYTEEWHALCKASAVGEYEPGKTFGAYGNRRNKTVARDCQKEIEHGKQPNIPFANDVVYLPFPERTHWPFQAAGGLSEIPEEKSSEGQALIETTGNDRAKGRLPRIGRKEEAVPSLKENTESVQETETVRKTSDKQPTRMRSVRKISNPGRVTAATATTMPLPKNSSRTIQRTRSTKDVVKETVAPPEPQLSRTRSVKDVVPLEPHITRTTIPARGLTDRMEPPPRPQRSNARISTAVRSVSPEFPASDPASVLAQIHTFRDNVARALQKKPSRSRRDQPTQLPFVSKWVDYSRKHGVGFVLEDGTVGCLAVGGGKHPVTTASIPDGHSHLVKASKDPNYIAQAPIEYYAATKENSGLSRVEVTATDRLEHLQHIWQRFGKYMCVQLGMEDGPRKKIPVQNNFVKFYQRLGNAGFWGFGDGSFQVRNLLDCCWCLD